MHIIKLLTAFLLGVLLSAGTLSVLVAWTRPRPVTFAPASIEIDVVRLNGENYLLISGPTFNVLGAHQGVVYRVNEDSIELGFFVTRLTFWNRGGFQGDWPILIHESKLLSQRVRITCRTRTGEQVIAEITKIEDDIAIDVR